MFPVDPPERFRGIKREHWEEMGEKRDFFSTG